VRLLLAALLSALAGAQEGKPLDLVQTIPMPKVEGRIDHLAHDAKAGRLIVAALENNTVEVLDLAQGKVVHRIEGLREPQGILFLDGQIVVASGGDGSCRFYDGSTFKLAKTVDCKDDADNVRYDAETKRVYVGYGSGGLAVIDPEKGAKVGDIPLEGHPESFQLESKGKRIFVNVPKAGHIAVVDREKRSVIARWKLSAGANFPMALDEDGHRLFVGCRQPSKLLVFDTESGKELAAVECSGDTDDVFYDPASKRVLLSCGAGTLDVFDAASAAPKRIGKVATAAGARTCLRAPDSGLIFLAVPHRGSQPSEVRVYRPAP
jgi:DNA-binding beta-propeller fold protein YncE